jgi:hypothetical protein
MDAAYRGVVGTGGLGGGARKTTPQRSHLTVPDSPHTGLSKTLHLGQRSSAATSFSYSLIAIATSASVVTPARALA